MSLQNRDEIIHKLKQVLPISGYYRFGPGQDGIPKITEIQGGLISRAEVEMIAEFARVNKFRRHQTMEVEVSK